MLKLKAEHYKKEIPIGTGWQYVNEVDLDSKELYANNIDFAALLDEIIALDVASYLMYHISGPKSFDQGTAEALMKLSHKKKSRLKMYFYTEYINKNIW